MWFYSSLCSCSYSVSCMIVFAAAAASPTTLAIFSPTPADVASGVTAVVSGTISSGLGTPAIPRSSVSKTANPRQACQQRSPQGRPELEGWGRVVSLPSVDPAAIGPIDLSPYARWGGIVKVRFSPMHMSNSP